MTSSVEVRVAGVRHVVDARAADVTFANASNVSAAKATDVAPAKATHAAAMSSTSAAATAAGLCTRGKKAAGKHRTCQNHHHSSSHDILHRVGRTFRHRLDQALACLSKVKPTSRCTGDVNVCLSSLLNSCSSGLNTACARTWHQRAPDQQPGSLPKKRCAQGDFAPLNIVLADTRVVPGDWGRT
jgi:hypothetical protein